MQSNGNCVITFLIILQIFEQKTAAFHRLKDDVPDDIKAARHMELATIFRDESLIINKSMIGEKQLVLIEGVQHLDIYIRIITYNTVCQLSHSNAVLK